MSNNLRTKGLTLVELLVAISVLTIVTALVIPRLRVVNKDRNIRETARIVGSVFSSARERAIAEGMSEVIIERNLNFIDTTADGNNVYYAGTRMYEARAIPSYTGDEKGDQCNVTVASNKIMVSIPTPFENGTVRQGDFVSIDGGKARYRIDSALITDPMDSSRMQFSIAWDNRSPFNSDPFSTTGIDFDTGTPAPPVTQGLDFEIFRQPVKIESTVVDLPAGYIIDLRYSGPNDPGIYEASYLSSGNDDGDTFTAFGLATDPMADINTEAVRRIRVRFNRTGSLDRAIFSGQNELIGQSLYFYLSEFDPNAPTDTAQNAANALLSIAENLWLTVGVNGGVNIGYNAPPPIDDIATMISNSRLLSRSRVSANQ